jgi:hypothetical protein
MKIVIDITKEEFFTRFRCEVAHELFGCHFGQCNPEQQTAVLTVLESHWADLEKEEAR